jgi:hypothetical protein
MHRRSRRNRPERKRIAGANLGSGASFNLVTHLQGVGRKNISPVPVGILYQRYPCGTVRVVLNGDYLTGDSMLVTLEVYDPQASLVSSTAMTHRDLAL